MQDTLYFDASSVTTLEEITELANRLLATTFTVQVYRNEEAKEINLADKGWTFEFDGGKTRFGCCKPRKKTISVSLNIASLNLDKAMKIEDTIRHELAHALQYVVYGYSAHDKEWTIIARSIGSNGERCYSSKKEGINLGKTKYTTFCKTDGCDSGRGYHKFPRKIASGRVACAKCCTEHNRGKFSPDYLLQYKQNY